MDNIEPKTHKFNSLNLNYSDIVRPALIHCTYSTQDLKILIKNKYSTGIKISILKSMTVIYL